MMRKFYSSDVNDPTYWPRGLPPVNIVQQWMGSLDPRLWDTDIDEVAVSRVLAGDRSILPGLTLFERADVLDHLYERTLTEPWDHASHGAQPIGYWGGEVGLSLPPEEYWLHALCRAWRYQHAGRLCERLSKRRHRVRAA